MAWAEFEEKEYETAALGELMRRDGEHSSFAFSAGQVLEKIVGYDAVAAPDAAHAVWQILQVPRPSGVRLLPSFWNPGVPPAQSQLPSLPVTLILQFKRPEYLYGFTAAQRKLWHRPYFRFTREPGQHRVLARLERSLGRDALVRYAAPAMWRRGELEAAHISGTVIGSSGFVSPDGLARHRVWTYVQAGTDGRANPDGTPVRFERLSDLLDAAFDRAQTTALVPSEGWGDHVVRLGHVAKETTHPPLRRRINRWQMSLRASQPALSDVTIERIGAIAALSSVLASVNATWISFVNRY